MEGSMDMRKDPVVEEVRRAGAELAKAAGNDLHRFCEKLRKAERAHQDRLVRRAPRVIAR